MRIPFYPVIYARTALRNIATGRDGCDFALRAAPEKVRAVGKRASEDLYLSWSDAVAVAYERYGVVVENYRAGRYQREKNLSDVVVAMQGALMEKLGQMEGFGDRMNDYLARPLDRIGDLLMRK